MSSFARAAVVRRVQVPWSWIDDQQTWGDGLQEADERDGQGEQDGVEHGDHLLSRVDAVFRSEGP